jgi:hypothetical protein
MRKLTRFSGILVLLGCLAALPATAAAVSTAEAHARAADTPGLAANWLESIRQALAWLVPVRAPITPDASITAAPCGPGTCTDGVGDPTPQAGEVIDPDG